MTIEPLPVLYRDDALAIVCKPAGLMVHDSALARGETQFAADALRAQFGHFGVEEPQSSIQLGHRRRFWLRTASVADVGACTGQTHDPCLLYTSPSPRD